MNKNVMDYEVPQVEVIEVEVEKGFAQSPGSSNAGGGNDGWEEEDGQ